MCDLSPHSRMRTQRIDDLQWLVKHHPRTPRPLAVHLADDTGSSTAPCCAAVAAALGASATAATANGGLAAVLQQSTLLTRWGYCSATFLCEAWARRGNLECASQASFTAWLAAQVPEVRNGRIHVARVEVIHGCSEPEADRWNLAFNVRAGEQRCLSIGTGWIAPNRTSVYHCVVGFLRYGPMTATATEEGDTALHLEVFDTTCPSWLWPSTADPNSSATSIQAWRVVVPPEAEAKAEAGTPPVIFNGHVIPCNTWFTFSREVATRTSCRLVGHMRRPPSVTSSAQQPPLTKVATTSAHGPIPLHMSLLKASPAPSAPSSTAVTVFLTAMTVNDANPLPGLGVARSIRKAFGDQVRLVGVDFSPEAAGLLSEVLDDTLVLSDFQLLKPGEHQGVVRQLLETTPNSLYLSCADLEIVVLNADCQLEEEEEEEEEISAPPPALLMPPPQALTATAKPDILAAEWLGCDVPPFLFVDQDAEGADTGLTTLQDKATSGCVREQKSFLGDVKKEKNTAGVGDDPWGLHCRVTSFCSAHGFPVAVKGPYHDSVLARSLREVRKAITEHRRVWGLETEVHLQAVRVGREGSIAYAAYRGELLGAVCMRKTLPTPQQKVWGAEVELLREDSTLWGTLARAVSRMNYTGGGEVEFMQAMDGTRTVFDWNMRFPAWIFGTSIVHGAAGNLPARLVAAAADRALGDSRLNTFLSRQLAAEADNALVRGTFVRTVIETLPSGDLVDLGGAEACLGAKPVVSAAATASSSSKGSAAVIRPGGHPSRATELSKTLARWYREKAAAAAAVSEDKGIESAATKSCPPAATSCPGPLATALDRAVASIGNNRSTPFLCLDAERIRANIAAIATACQGAAEGTGLRVDVLLSIKTNPHPALLGVAHDAGMAAEVISLGEAALALRLGFNAEYMVLNGAAKWYEPVCSSSSSTESACAARRVRLAAVVADSVEELEALADRICAGQPLHEGTTLVVESARVLGLRLAPPRTASRFGVDIEAPEELVRAARALARLPTTQQHGYHLHFAQSTLGSSPWAAAVEATVGAASELDRLAGRHAAIVDLGGGWAPGALGEAGALLRHIVAKVVPSYLPAAKNVYFEPGKDISQSAGLLLTRVLAVRRATAHSRARALAQGWRGPMGQEADLAPGRDVVLDTTICELPALQSHAHPMFYRPSAGGTWQKITTRGRAARDCLLGRTCMETDILSSGVHLPAGLCVGDWVALARVGAYDVSMAYNFGAGVLNHGVPGGVVVLK